MTRYGVPDDDMPDSQQPPTWGSAYDERDLEAVLSGETEGIPDALRAVAGTLSALRGAPTHDELAGEAGARAVFRAAFPGRPPAGEARAADAGPGAVPARTLILPSAESARHRRVRPRRAPGSRWPALLLGSAAVVLAAVLTTAFTGIIHFPVTLSSFGRNSASGSTVTQGTGRSPGSQSVDGTGAATEPSATPDPGSAPAPAAQEPAMLCREYYAFLTHREPPGAGSGEKGLLGRLRELAGPHQTVFSYCRPYAGFPSWGRNLPSLPPLPRGLAGRTGRTRAGTGSGRLGGRTYWNWPTPAASPSQPAVSGGPAPAASGG